MCENSFWSDFFSFVVGPYGCHARPDAYPDTEANEIADASSKHCANVDTDATAIRNAYSKAQRDSNLYSRTTPKHDSHRGA